MMQSSFSRRQFCKVGGIGTAGMAALAAGVSNVAQAVEMTESAKNWEPVRTVETDVVVVGAGSGLWAAYKTTEAGLATVVIEKAASCETSNTNNIGGTTAADTKVQASAGVECPIGTVYARLMSFAEGTVNCALVRRCLEASGKCIDALTDMGADIMVGADRYGVGFQSVHVYLSPNRMPLVESAVLGAGGQIDYNTEAKELIVEGGRVVGLYAEGPDGDVEYRAKAVVLACGGFLEDDEMLKKYYGANVQIGKFRTAYNDGAGIKMALKAGAMMDVNFAMGSLADAAGFNGRAKDIEGTYLFDRNQAFNLGTYGTLNVDHTGERFIDEFLIASNPLAFGGAIQTRIGWYYAIADQKMVDYLMTHSAYDRVGRTSIWPVGELLFDEPQERLQEDINKAIDEGWAWKGDTIDELADVAGLPLLADQVARYNGACEAGEDDQFFTPGDFLVALNEGPFYAIQYQVGGLSTMGGIRTDNYCRAVDSGDNAIAGLYVCSSDNGSAFNAPYYDTGGTCNAMCIGTSWVAGETAVADIAG